MVEQNKKISWRNIGRGSFRLASGKIIKPNQVFEADPAHVPVAFRDTIVPVEGVIPSPEVELKVESVTYEVRSRGAGWYDVFNSVGKKMNEGGLRREAAAKLVEELSS